MTPEQVLSYPPRVLSQAQREFYFDNGYLEVKGLVDSTELEPLQRGARQLVERSRHCSAADVEYVVAAGHSAEHINLRRIKFVESLEPTFWSFATGLPADIAADLVGPDVKFHSDQINFKWQAGDDPVEWHQDILFYPHTNYSPLVVGLYLADTEENDGALCFIPGSHDGPLYDHHDRDGNWRGCVQPEDVARIDTARARPITGAAGTLLIHNCRTVHGSPPSETGRPRPLLINAYTSADAFGYTPNPQPSRRSGQIVRGRPARVAHHDPRPCLLPPDWSNGYTSIFEAQRVEEDPNRSKRP